MKGRLAARDREPPLTHSCELRSRTDRFSRRFTPYGSLVHNMAPRGRAWPGPAHNLADLDHLKLITADVG